MIANAERDASGNYTDKGQADITTSKLIIKHLHDYDDGLTLGLGITPAPKSIGKDVNGKDVAPIHGSEVRAQVGCKAESQVVNPVIGDGNLKVDGKVVDARSRGAKAVHEKVSAKERTKMHFDVEFVTSANHQAEQDARDNLKNAKTYKPDWVQKSSADQNDKATDADKKPAPQPAKAKTSNKTSHREESVDEEGKQDKTADTNAEPNAESVAEEENVFVSFLKGVAKIPGNFVNELFGVQEAEAAAVADVVGDGSTISQQAQILASLLAGGMYRVVGGAVVDATGAVVAVLPATLVALVPYLEYKCSKDTLNSLLVEVQRSRDLGLSEAKISAALNVDIDGDGPTDLSYEATIGLLNLSRINHQEAQKQKELPASSLSGKMGSGSLGLEEGKGQVLFKKGHAKGKDKDKAKLPAEASKVQAASGAPDPDDEKYKEYERFKKKDGSKRYECESSESPQWRDTKPFKGKEGYRSNGANKAKHKEYYRWDELHKDIEVYDDKARYLGSKDPVTGKKYRPGTMQKNPQLKDLI